MITKKVLLVDDHKIVADGIEIYINNIKGYEVIEKVYTGAKALEVIKEMHPDLILLDHFLPDCEGIDLIPEILKIDPSVKIVILTSFEDADLAIRAIKYGAKGFLTKKINEKGLTNVLAGVFEGDKTWLDPHITYEVIQNIIHTSQKEPQILSMEEKQLLKLVAKGKTNQQIAKELFLSEQTVKNYLLKMYKRFGLRNRSEAANLAIKHHVI